MSAGIDRALWVTWCDVAPRDRETYLAWLHGSYLPALLKPAPRGLAAQLWMLKHESPEAKGLDDLQRLASSGRTSIPIDKDVPGALYRAVGYQIGRAHV